MYMVRVSNARESELGQPPPRGEPPRGEPPRAVLLRREPPRGQQIPGREVVYREHNESDRDFAARIEIMRSSNIPHVVVDMEPDEDYYMYLTRVSDARERELGQQPPRREPPRGEPPREQGIIQRDRLLYPLIPQRRFETCLPYEIDTFVRRDVEFNNMVAASEHGELLLSQPNDAISDQMLAALRYYLEGNRVFDTTVLDYIFEYELYVDRLIVKIEYGLNREQGVRREQLLNLLDMINNIRLGRHRRVILPFGNIRPPGNRGPPGNTGQPGNRFASSRGQPGNNRSLLNRGYPNRGGFTKRHKKNKPTKKNKKIKKYKKNNFTKKNKNTKKYKRIILQKK